MMFGFLDQKLRVLDKTYPSAYKELSVLLETRRTFLKKTSRGTDSKLNCSKQTLNELTTLVLNSNESKLDIQSLVDRNVVAKNANVFVRKGKSSCYGEESDRKFKTFFGQMELEAILVT
jgi:hypothetical protein